MYGWHPDIQDIRDYLFHVEEAPVLPSSVDLRSSCPPIYDQGELGSCTANAIAAALEFDQLKQGETPFTPSRLFIYWNERSIERTVLSDAGAKIRDGMKVVASLGAPPESTWPYDISQFTVRPADAAYEQARAHKAILYQRVAQDITHIRAALAAGYPVIFGFTVYDFFESQMMATTGHLTMPGKGERVVGGHAVVAVGYDNSNQQIIVRNSWGTDWGLQGYFTMPYTYITHPQLAQDFWTVQRVQ
jgi:C1A family cysteine protease